MRFAWPVLHRRPTVRGVIGLVLGLAGVALLLEAAGYAFDAGKLISVVLSLSCAMLFALGSVLNPIPLPMPQLAILAWRVGIGCLAMLPLGIGYPLLESDKICRAFQSNVYDDAANELGGHRS
jgi:drug/metabolite transporter (DMT)-like permease